MATEIIAPQKALAQVDRESLKGDVSDFAFLTRTLGDAVSAGDLSEIEKKLKQIRDAALDSLAYIEKYCK